MATQLSRRAFLGTALAAGAAGAQTPASRPNVLVILSDDQGWGDLSVNGNTNISTPNIDTLARDGALFERFFVCPVCAPTRAEFLTGRYHARGGVRGVQSGTERLNLDETTIAQTFQAAGYSTGIFGKWHNGGQHPYHPNARGFDEFYGFTQGHWGQYFDTEMDHNGQLVRGQGYISDDLTNHALDFVAQHARGPFFCYLALNTPHSPMQVPERFYEKFSHFTPKLKATDPALEDVPMTRAALAMCENIDWNVGRVFAKLEELRLRDDTIVIYFSDNGPNSWRWNGGMKGRKGSVDEGGVRSPFMIRWPGHIAAGRRIPQIAGALDLLPTLADLAQIPLTSRKPLDGRSLKPLVSGSPAPPWRDRTIFSLQAGRISARTQQYRLDSDGRLFDMAADPAQTRDVASEHPEIAANLRKQVSEWRAEIQENLGPDTRPFTVGYAKSTLLTAGDGVPSGGVKRSAIYPNSSFFTNWTTTDGLVAWDIEIGQAGAYSAEVFYTCRAQDVGAAVELRFGDSRAAARIAEAHDPPLIGAAFDRVPRDESYVKDFRPFPLGRLNLPKGRGKLELRATEIKGERAIDVRSVRLTLADPA